MSEPIGIVVQGATGVQSSASPSAPVGRSETERLDWIFRQAEDFSCAVLQDQPGDGLYRVTGMHSEGLGETPRQAVDAAMTADDSRQRDRVPR